MSENERMTADELAAVEALLNGVTPGKWGIDSDEPSIVFAQDGWWNGKEFVAEVGGRERSKAEISANANFIAAAPDMVRRLLAEVHTLRDARDALTGALRVTTEMLDEHAQKVFVMGNGYRHWDAVQLRLDNNRKLVD